MEEWSSYLEYLNRAGILLNQTDDRLVWAINTLDGSVTVKAAYDHMMESCSDIDGKWWAHSLWHWHMPTKLKCFFWLVIHNRTLTWDNLRRRGWTGPGICVLCREADEDLHHLFFNCCFAREIWRSICTTLRVHWQFGDNTVESIVQHWIGHQKKHKSLLVFYCWGIWRCRNSSIFQNVLPNHHSLCIKILEYYGMFGDFHNSPKGKRVVEPISDLLFPVGFFDGVA